MRSPPGVLAAGPVGTVGPDGDSMGTGDCSVPCQWTGTMLETRWGGALASKGLTRRGRFQGTLADRQS